MINLLRLRFRCLGYSTRLSPFSLFPRASERASEPRLGLGPCIYVPWLIYPRASALHKLRARETAKGRGRKREREREREKRDREKEGFSVHVTRRCIRATAVATRRSCTRNAAATNENRPLKPRTVSDADISIEALEYAIILARVITVLQGECNRVSSARRDIEKKLNRSP